MISKPLFFAACLIPLAFTQEISTPLQTPKPLTLAQVIDTCAAYYHIPKAVIIGVAISETALGTDGVGVPEKANNLFGVKKGDGWKGDYYQACSTCARWRSYCTPQASVPDFCKFIIHHYPHLLKKPVSKWLLFGYGNSKYEKIGYFNQFENDCIEPSAHQRGR